MITSQSAIKQYILTNPSQLPRSPDINLQSLLSSCSALSPSNMPSLSALALTALSNGLQTAKTASCIPMASSNILSGNVATYPPNPHTVASSLPQMTSIFPTVAPRLSQMVSGLPTAGPSQMVSGLPRMAPCLPSTGSSLSQMASNLPTYTPSLPPALSNFPIASPTCHTAGVDVSVINNLAVALQLMILSNILNASPKDSEQNLYCSNTDVVDKLPNPIEPLSVSYMPNSNENQYMNIQTQINDDRLINANYLGSSSFAENSMMLQNYGGNPILQGCFKKPPNPRPGFSLMSPYEALCPGSSYSDPILSSPYASCPGQSDYNAAFSGFESFSGFDSDLFSMTDIL